MFEQVHMAVAMGNAKESVKCAADEITSDCDEDGAAVLFREILPGSLVIKATWQYKRVIASGRIAHKL